ncbi:hypothetical protein C0992_001161, partial [Termitomyces sp. T32_za158]
EAMASSVGPSGLAVPLVEEVEELAESLRQADELESHQQEGLLHEIVRAQLKVLDA